jgi:hypothetical protein
LCVNVLPPEKRFDVRQIVMFNPEVFQTVPSFRRSFVPKTRKNSLCICPILSSKFLQYKTSSDQLFWDSAPSPA